MSLSSFLMCVLLFVFASSYAVVPEECVRGMVRASAEARCQYFRCINNQWRRVQCLHGQEFNPQTASCNKSGSTTKCFEGTVWSDFEDPHSYFLCVSREWEKVHCFGDQVYNSRNSSCDDSEPSIEQCVGNSYWPDVEDLHQYYHCVEGRWGKVRCKSNQEFDQRKNCCL